MARSDVAVVGVGMTKFTKQSWRGHGELAKEAVRGALDHAGVGPRDVGAAFCGSAAAGTGIGQRVLKNLGLTGLPIVNVENACASGSTAVREAYAWIRAGLADCALAFGVEILSSHRGPLPILDSWVSRTGLNLPGWYALKARRHMIEFGLTAPELASVVVKSRRFAAENPKAHFRAPTSIEEVLSSPMVADPLTLYQCCPKVDGAAAAILCSGDFARSRGLRPVWIRASAMLSGTHVYTDRPGHADVTARAAAQAWEQSGFGPHEVQVAECHDAFSIGEILCAESLGLFGAGDGGRAAAAGVTSLGGSGPVVNPSGGLLSRGHPLGASGVAQLAEITWQLRGEAGGRQVPGARRGVVHTMGATEFDLEANACCVFVLEA